MFFSISFGMLSRLFHEWVHLIVEYNAYEYFSFPRYFSELNRFSTHLECLLRDGADINHVLVRYETCISYAFLIDRDYFRYLCSDLMDFNLIGDWCLQPLYIMKDQPFYILRYIRLLLRNGLSFFYGDIKGTKFSLHENDLIGMLFFTRAKCCICIAYQLVALGFGRRELHPGDLPVRNVGLEYMRMMIVRAHKDPDFDVHRYRMLLQLVERFDACPLPLQQLARIAIRRAVGGVDFARRVRKLAHLTPPPLLRYVADADELLTEDNEEP